MIERLRYSEINFQRYDQCIANSVQNNFYAQRRILDEFCDRWELLVFNDYENVMPVPVRVKWGFKYVSMPVFIQQLGVFGKGENQEINQRFLKELINAYRILSYSFNCHNTFGSALSTRKNYLIPRQNYENLYRGSFSKGRKSVLKKRESLTILKENISPEIERFILSNFKGLNNQNEIRMFLRFLVSYASNLHLCGVYLHNSLISLGIFTETQHSFGLLALVNDEKFRHENAASFLVDEFLKKEIANKSLDFMGGNLRGIEIFFKSFGAELTTYPVIQNSRKEMIKNIFKY